MTTNLNDAIVDVLHTYDFTPGTNDDWYIADFFSPDRQIRITLIYVGDDHQHNPDPWIEVHGPAGQYIEIGRATPPATAAAVLRAAFGAQVALP